MVRLKDDELDGKTFQERFEELKEEIINLGIKNFVVNDY